MVVGGRIADVISDSAVHIGMADGVPHVVAEKAGQVGDALLPLLSGLQIPQMGQITAEKVVHMVLVHVSAHVPVIPVAQNGDIIEKDIRSLKPQLVKPAVFCDNMLQRLIPHIIVSFHTHYVMSGKTRHRNPSFLKKYSYVNKYSTTVHKMR